MRSDRVLQSSHKATEDHNKLHRRLIACQQVGREIAPNELIGFMASLADSECLVLTAPVPDLHLHRQVRLSVLVFELRFGWWNLKSVAKNPFKTIER